VWVECLSVCPLVKKVSARNLGASLKKFDTTVLDSSLDSSQVHLIVYPIRFFSFLSFRAANILVATVLSLALVGCTQEEPKGSSVRVTLPDSGTLAQWSSKPSEKNATKFESDDSSGIYQSVSATMPFPTWGLDDPTSLAEIDCFAVFVTGPELPLSSNKCASRDGSVDFPVGLWVGGFQPGASIELAVPAGSGRKVSIVGMKSATATACHDFKSLPLDFLKHSRPMVLGSSVLDLAPGEASVAISISMNNAKSFDGC